MAANNLIQIKRTSVSGRAPNTSILHIGELALNMADGILYSSNGVAVFEIGSNNTNVNVSANLTIKSVVANGTIGTYGQMLLSNSSGSFWHSLFSEGPFPPANPVYGDIWYSTTFSKPYMWSTDGGSSFWYDFLPFSG